jgi:peptidoglycan hydrolase-like protein with peptidoglycan-binding domain
MNERNDIFQVQTKRDAVRNLQRYLRRLSLAYGSIPSVPIDGIFESETARALSEFQRIFGLPITGTADLVTWDTLYAEYEKLIKTDQILSPDLFPPLPQNYEISEGEPLAATALVQWMLNELTVLYDELPLLSVSGIYDEPTARAVSLFQRVKGLPVTGKVDRQTWNSISAEYEHLSIADG